MQKFGLKGTKSKRDRREAEAVEEADAALDFKVSSLVTVWRHAETACLLCSKLHGGFEALCQCCRGIPMLPLCCPLCGQQALWWLHGVTHEQWPGLGSVPVACIEAR